MNQTTFYDPSAFSFLAPLREAWTEILDEYRTVRGELTDWVEPELYRGSWTVYPIFSFPHGERVDEHAERCPITAALVEEHVPTHGVAGFSVLGPRTTVQPHEGYQGSFLRCHLGLDVPEGDCSLESRGTRRRWRDGQLLVFDDRHPHQAWNHTDRDRVLLLVDFEP